MAVAQATGQEGSKEGLALGRPFEEETHNGRQQRKLDKPVDAIKRGQAEIWRYG